MINITVIVNKQSTTLGLKLVSGETVDEALDKLYDLTLDYALRGELKNNERLLDQNAS